MDTNNNGSVSFHEFSQAAGAFELGNRTSAEAVSQGFMRRLSALGVARVGQLVANPSEVRHDIRESNPGCAKALGPIGLAGAILAIGICIFELVMAGRAFGMGNCYPFGR